MSSLLSPEEVRERHALLRERSAMDSSDAGRTGIGPVRGGLHNITPEQRRGSNPYRNGFGDTGDCCARRESDAAMADGQRDPGVDQRRRCRRVYWFAGSLSAGDDKVFADSRWTGWEGEGLGHGDCQRIGIASRGAGTVDRGGTLAFAAGAGGTTGGSPNATQSSIARGADGGRSANAEPGVKACRGLRSNGAEVTGASVSTTTAYATITAAANNAKWDDHVRRSAGNDAACSGDDRCGGGTARGIGPGFRSDAGGGAEPWPHQRAAADDSETAGVRCNDRHAALGNGRRIHDEPG